MSLYTLEDFVGDIEACLEERPSTPEIVRRVSGFTGRLLADPRAIPDACRKPRPDHYARYLLHRDPRRRFVVMALVWSPGQGTPIHDHKTWGVAGILDEWIEVTNFDRLDDGRTPAHARLRERERMEVGEGGITHVMPPKEDIHRMRNGRPSTTVSVHVYGRELTECDVFDPETGRIERYPLQPAEEWEKRGQASFRNEA
jgi:predicted metal-dependent enzyme (double-stranded beta helix superfamily)